MSGHGGGEEIRSTEGEAVEAEDEAGKSKTCVGSACYEESPELSQHQRIQLDGQSVVPFALQRAKVFEDLMKRGGF